MKTLGLPGAHEGNLHLMAPRIALLSHRGGNIGHDFMAVGMTEALGQAFGPDAEIVHIEQHRPFDVYAAGDWRRWLSALPSGRLVALRRYLARPDVMAAMWRHLPAMDYNLALACGGPNLVPGASRTPEMHLLLLHLNGAFRERGVPMIDGAIGAAFPLEHPTFRFDAEDEAFYRKALALPVKVTVRDKVARNVCAGLGVDAELIPCGAIGMGRVIERIAGQGAPSGGHVVINFQERGANTDWGQGIDRKAWQATVRSVIDSVRTRHPVRLLAHNAYEAKLAAALAPDLPCDAPTTIEDYARTVRGAKAGLVSRIHAAIPMAGIGVPCVVTGTDTRLGTIETLGLPVAPAKQATAEHLIDVLESLIAASGQEKERLLGLRERTIDRYSQLFRSTAL